MGKNKEKRAVIMNPSRDPARFMFCSIDMANIICAVIKARTILQFILLNESKTPKKIKL